MVISSRSKLRWDQQRILAYRIMWKTCQCETKRLRLTVMVLDNTLWPTRILAWLHCEVLRLVLVPWFWMILRRAVHWRERFSQSSSVFGQCCICCILPTSSAPQLVQFDNSLQTPPYDWRQIGRESCLAIIWTPKKFTIFRYESANRWNFRIFRPNQAWNLRVFGGEVREVALAFNSSSHQGDRRKTSQNCHLLLILWSTIWKATTGFKFQFNWLSLSSMRFVRNVDWNQSQRLEKEQGLFGVNHSGRSRSSGRPAEPRQWPPPCGSLESVLAKSVLKSNELFNPFGTEVQQRGIQATRQIISQLLEGIQMTEKHPVLLVDCMPNRFLI